MRKLQPTPAIYLAGGMRTNWQDKVTARIQRLTVPVLFIDPRNHGYADEVSYTSWDICGVERSDIVFAYLEADNPSGAGLALELGVAEGLRRAGQAAKHVIFVCEPDHPHYRYFGMARACADVVAPTLQEGIEELCDHLMTRKQNR